MSLVISIAVAAVFALFIIIAIERFSAKRDSRPEDEEKKELVKNLEETTHLLDESYERERILMKRNEELVEVAADYSHISVLLYDYIWGETADTEAELLTSRRASEFEEVMKRKAWEDILATRENLFSLD